MSHDWLMMTLERRRDLITVLEPYFLPKILHSTKSYFIKVDHTFYGFTGVITHLGCWENTRKACKSLAYFYRGKPIDSHTAYFYRGKDSQSPRETELGVRFKEVALLEKRGW